MNKSTSEYWKEWFDERAKNANSDYVLNRGTTLRLDKLEARSAKQFIEAVAPTQTDIILDAGCGSGRNLSIFSSRVKRIVGLDFSERMLDRARQRVADEKLSNVCLTQGSVAALDFPNNHFDKVICASVLQYLDVKDCELALREMVRVCRPGGTLVLHIKNGTSLYALSLRLAKTCLRLAGREPKPEQYRSLRWHTSVLEGCGATMVDYDSFGIFTFVPMSTALVRRILKLEIDFLKGKRWKRFGVNFQMTVRVGKERHRMANNLDGKSAAKEAC